jgi:hypothetical protein
MRQRAEADEIERLIGFGGWLEPRLQRAPFGSRHAATMANINDCNRHVSHSTREIDDLVCRSTEAQSRELIAQADVILERDRVRLARDPPEEDVIRVPPSRRIARRPVVYTILSGDRPVVAFLGSSQKEAQELLREDWFLEELGRKRSGGEPLWDGRAKLTARSAVLDEQQKFEAEARADDGSGDVALVYLLDLD